MALRDNSTGKIQGIGKGEGALGDRPGEIFSRRDVPRDNIGFCKKVRPWRHRVNWGTVPMDYRPAIAAWVEDGIPITGALSHILQNDLDMVVSTTPEGRWDSVLATLRFLRSFAPKACWGSDQAIQSWKGLPDPGETPAELAEDGETDPLGVG